MLAATERLNGCSNNSVNQICVAPSRYADDSFLR
jgi:hypothetical protein